MASSELVYGYKFGSKVFGGTTVKDAYLKAAKWYATEIISKDIIHDIHVQFIKDKSEPKVTLVLWAALPEGDVREEHCKICREIHSVFYSSTGYDCSSCTVLGYLKRMENKALIKASHCKQVITSGKHGGT